MTHSLILLVVIPLIATPVCILLHKRLLIWPVVFTVSWITFYIACDLMLAVRDGGEIYYYLGSWAAPWGIEYRLDSLNALVAVIVSGVNALVISFARASIFQEIPEDRIYLFYCAYLLNLAGLLGVTVTGDVFNMFVFIEISSLSSYAMISLGKHRQALLAAYRYLIMGTIGATFILIGIGLLYAVTGTLNIPDLHTRLSAMETSRTVITAGAFLTVGITLKFALFPLHSWLPNAYTYAPSVVSAFLAGTTTKVFIYVLLRFLFSIFGTGNMFDIVSLDKVLMICALLAIFSGSISAIYQNNIKKMLAYSSIAQIGYIVLGISISSVAGLTAGIIHLFNHALMKTALFLCVACIVYRTGKVSLKSLGGIGKAMPWTMAAFVVAGLSMIGVPLTVGFISKWYLILSALNQEAWWLALAILVGSLITIIYVWRVVETAWFRTPASELRSGKIREAPLSMLVPLWILVIANIYFGVDTGITAQMARQSAELLMGMP